MECESARELALDALAAGRPRPPEAERHLGACAACREEVDALARAWAALGTLPDEAPAPEVARRLRRRVRRAAAREAVASLEAWQRAALAGVAGFALSLALSGLLPYETVLAACARLVAASAPTPAASALAGAVYGLVPMLLGAALPARRPLAPVLVGGLEATVVFLAVALPYVVLRCAEFPTALLAGFAGGLALGAWGGATSSLALHRVRLAAHPE